MHLDCIDMTLKAAFESSAFPSDLIFFVFRVYLVMSFSTPSVRL